MESNREVTYSKRYKIIDEIGKGGMGKVYKVHDIVKDDIIALKEMSRRYSNSPSSILQFKNEFRIMSEFQHPNTVKVFEFGLSPDNIPFITMEFVKGKNLSELGIVSSEQMADLLTQLCQALGYIHSRLYIHRDLKPDNIKLIDDGSIKLLDYGLMSQLGVPAPSKISGTYYYMAPETITGGIIDESTDLYSLGVIAYELLTGRKPFTGTSREILRGHLKKCPEEPRKIRPDISPYLDKIVMKLLEKDKSKRYRNTSEVLEDLQLITGKKKPVESIEKKQAYLYSSKMVGRDNEREFFNNLLIQLKCGDSGSLLIGAPAGMGKTRLMNEMKTLAEIEEIETIQIEGKHVGGYIYGWLDELLCRLLPLSEKDAIEKFASRLVGICPLLKEKTGFEPKKAEDKEIVESAVGWLSSSAQDREIAIFSDDLQWVDMKSFNIMNELIRRSGDFKALFIGCFRDDKVDKSSPVWHTIEEGLSGYMELSPLTRKQTRELIENLLYPTKISDEFLTFCFNNSGGNVFDLIEFLRDLVADNHLTRSGNRWMEPVDINAISMPERIEDRLISRIDKLREKSRNLADVGAVFDDEIDLEEWREVSGFDTDIFLETIDDLIRNQIILKINGKYLFTHDKIRTALYDNLEQSMKKEFHRRVARMLEKTTREKDIFTVPLIARHFVASCNPEKAVEYSLEAAKLAEEIGAEWEAFDHYKNAVRFLRELPEYPEHDKILIEVYEKAAQFSSAAWIDAHTCLGWLQKAIDYYQEKNDMEKVFNLSLSYIVSSAISSNYESARRKIPEIIKTCKVEEGSLQWAILYGAGVCLVDWYQGYQGDCYDHAVSSIKIFEKQLDTLPAPAWPCYSWAIFWRDKARAYLGKPIEMVNIEKNHQLMEEGKSDGTIYWHTLTAVGARAAFSGRYHDLMEWKKLVSRLSRDMGKIHWFECWISHSYLYGALFQGEFSQLESHIERVQASPDPYQVRLAYLFRGRLRLIQGLYDEAEENFNKFFELEKISPDNSLLEGYVYLAKTYIETGRLERAEELIETGDKLATEGKYSNPLYRMQFEFLRAELCMAREDYQNCEIYLNKALGYADSLDNPIWRGFIKKLKGILYQKREKYEKAREFLSEAIEIFLALDNKYQAGQVVAILQAIPGGEGQEFIPEDVTAGVSLDDTSADKDQTGTMAEDKIPGVMEKVDLEKTATEETDVET